MSDKAYPTNRSSCPDKSESLGLSKTHEIRYCYPVSDRICRKSIYPSARLALALGSMVHIVNLFAGLALALSNMNCESLTWLKLSQQANRDTRGQNPRGES